VGIEPRLATRQSHLDALRGLDSIYNLNGDPSENGNGNGNGNGSGGAIFLRLRRMQNLPFLTEGANLEGRDDDDGDHVSVSASVSVAVQAVMLGERKQAWPEGEFLSFFFFQQLKGGKKDMKKGTTTTTTITTMPDQILINVSTFSPATFSLARRWVRECVEGHAKCRERFGKEKIFRPKRLLEVTRQMGMEGEGEVCLRLCDGAAAKNDDDNDDNRGKSIEWVCLSYCWGGKLSFTLSATTEATLRIGIPSSRLPRTVQDAAEVVLQLGLRYLWVDALCIRQDSADDWRHEAATMCDVYRGSFLTIAALGATDSNIGLFATRDPLMYAACPLFSLPDGGTVSAYPHWVSKGSDTWERWPL